MLSQKGPTPLRDFSPSDLKMSKSPILDFRFNNNQEIMKMVSTIARSSSAAKNKPPKKKNLLTPPSHTKPVSKLPSHLFLPFYCQLKSLSSPPLLLLQGPGVWVGSITIQTFLWGNWINMGGERRSQRVVVFSLRATRHLGPGFRPIKIILLLILFVF